MSAGAGLAGQAARAVGWGAAGSVAKLVLQFGTQIMLARILGPEQYGLFAMGVLVVSLATFLADFGMERTDAGIVHDQLVTPILADGEALFGEPERRLATVFEMQLEHFCC